jgi:hypothetical protein
MFNIKKAELPIGQLISLILVILVIVVVLVSVLNPSIWDWVRSLPDYKYNDTDKELPKENIIQSSCPNIVGKIKVENGYNYIYLNNQKTDLLWKEDRIELDEVVNEKIASIGENDIIKVDPKWFVYETRKKHPKLPDIWDLRLLDGAYKMFNMNDLCRLNEVKKTEILEDSSQKAWTIEKIIERYPEMNNYDFEKSSWVKIGYGLNNQDKRLGFDTRGDDVTEMKFKKVSDKIYIQFSDSDYLRDVSPWILLEYWNEYRSIVYISQEYILK